MNVAWLYGAGLLCLCGITTAQVPETGRWQELAFSSTEVHRRTADRYTESIGELAVRDQLDNDRRLLHRVQSIGAGLILTAMRIKPEAKDWDWEIHVTSDPNVDAFCMAGGKILVGSAFVHDLDLDDGELATLLGHEIAHALAEHHREELSEARHIVPQSAMSLDVMMERLHTDPSMQRRLAFLSNLQESEADQLGMVLVRQSGWPASAMVGFYQKLAMMDAPSVMASSHPTAASRVSMAKGMALLLAD